MCVILLVLADCNLPYCRLNTGQFVVLVLLDLPYKNHMFHGFWFGFCNNYISFFFIIFIFKVCLLFYMTFFINNLISYFFNIFPLTFRKKKRVHLICSSAFSKQYFTFNKFISVVVY